MSNNVEASFKTENLTSTNNLGLAGTESLATANDLAIFQDLGRTIADFRRRREISQKDFAEKCDITASYLSQVEKGHKMPSNALIKKFCEQLGISQSDLLRSLFIDSFLEAKDDSKRETIVILRNLLDKLLLDVRMSSEIGKKSPTHI